MGLSISHLHSQLDPFACKLMISIVTQQHPSCSSTSTPQVLTTQQRKGYVNKGNDIFTKKKVSLQRKGYIYKQKGIFRKKRVTLQRKGYLYSRAWTNLLRACHTEIQLCLPYICKQALQALHAHPTGCLWQR